MMLTRGGQDSRVPVIKTASSLPAWGEEDWAGKMALREAQQLRESIDLKARGAEQGWGWGFQG